MSLAHFQARVHRQWSEYHSTEVLCSYGPLKAPEVDNFDAYVAVVEDSEDWDLSDLTGGLHLSNHASTSVDYDQLRGVCDC